VHVHVHFVIRQIDVQHRHRELISRQEGPMRIDQRLVEERVPHGPAIDDQRDRVAVATRELRRSNEPGYGHSAHGAANVQHLRREVEAEKRAHTVPERSGAWSVEHRLAVVRDA
jgi:hypothetical protein